MSPLTLFLLLFSVSWLSSVVESKSRILLFGQEPFDNDLVSELENSTGVELVFQQSSCGEHFDVDSFVSYFENLMMSED